MTHKLIFTGFLALFVSTQAVALDKAHRLDLRGDRIVDRWSKYH